MNYQFVRVSDGDCEEIISVRNLIKVFKAEGYQGKAIIYEFRRYAGNISQWREEYPNTVSRDEAFDELVRTLCGENNVAQYVGWRRCYNDKQVEEEYEQLEEERKKQLSI